MTDAELKSLNDSGIRGIRFTVGNPQTAVVSIDMMEPLAKRIAAYGWHLQLNMDAQQIIDHADMLSRLPTTLVFDHMGKPPLPAGVNHPSHKVIRSLLDAGRAWVKISGAYIVSDIGPPTYADATPIAQEFVHAAPERRCGAATGRTPAPKFIRTTRCCSICSPSGRPTRRYATAYSSTIPQCFTASNNGNSGSPLQPRGAHR